MRGAIVSFLAVCCLAVACSRAEAPTTPVPTSAATAAATAPPATGTTPALPAPSGVRLTGRIPDTNATVPAGEGEAGRVTIEWTAVAGAEGYRIYRRDCAGAVTRALEVAATDLRYGPLQPCRPGGKVGVAAFTRAAESAIVFAP